jgi:hypothetical protein
VSWSRCRQETRPLWAGFLRAPGKNVEVQNLDRGDLALADRTALEFPLPEAPRFVLREQPIYLETTHPMFQTSNSRANAPTRADAVPLIRLQPGSGITVSVFDDLDRPLVDAMVQVRDSSGRYLATAFTDRESGMCHTPAILKPGRYTVAVQSAAHAPAWRTIAAGEVLSFHQFVLEPGGYITGKVISKERRTRGRSGRGLGRADDPAATASSTP